MKKEGRKRKRRSMKEKEGGRSEEGAGMNKDGGKKKEGGSLTFNLTLIDIDISRSETREALPITDGNAIQRDPTIIIGCIGWDPFYPAAAATRYHIIL